MLAELVDHVVGVDPDRDWITVAIVEARTSGVMATERFPAGSDGYRDAVLWADALTVASERAWVIEGTASYGRGLTVMLQRRGEWVIEFDRAERKAAKDGRDRTYGGPNLLRTVFQTSSPTISSAL